MRHTKYYLKFFFFFTIFTEWWIILNKVYLFLNHVCKNAGNFDTNSL